MLGLTPLGIVHTAISLVAVAAGVAAFIHHGQISWRSTAGRWYVLATIATCLTGFGIFRHGGFGIPHALGIVTLVVLAIAALAGQRRAFGSASPYVETVAYTTTFFFHMIPAFTETATRVPPGAPWATGPESPGLQAAIGVALVVYLVGAIVQVVRMRRAASTAGASR